MIYMDRMNSIKVQGYRPFRDFTAAFGNLEVLVGANGAGKSALFEFLKFLRDSTYQDIPPEIISGSVGQEIFHLPGPERLSWSIEVDFAKKFPLRYEGELTGPVGQIQIKSERLVSAPPDGFKGTTFMDMQGRKGVIRDPENKKLTQQELSLQRPNQLALSTATNPAFMTLYKMRDYVLSWRFYSAFRITNDKIRRPVLTEQEPVLHEDGGNLSAVLFYLMTEHRPIFDELQSVMRSMVPGFKGLSVKARGARGEVIAVWQEQGIDRDLSLADVSDGILRLLCWSVLCLLPNPPKLICIDEPDQGVHPRTLPVLAGLFKKASDRTQVLLATHASYFLTQFDLSEIAIMRKVNGESVFAKPANSDLMRSMLEDFGTDELEHLHRSDELERLS